MLSSPSDGSASNTMAVGDSSGSQFTKAADSSDGMNPNNSTKSTGCLSTDGNSDTAKSVTSTCRSVVTEEDTEKDAPPCNLSPRSNETGADGLFEEARKIVAKRFEGSEFDYRLDSVALLGVPRMSMNELALGKRLGKGSFSNVDEIRGIMLDRSSVPTGRNAMSSGHSSSWCTTSSTHIPSSHSTPPCLDRPVFPDPSEKVAAARASGIPAALKRIPRPNLGVVRQDTVASGNQESRVFMEQHCFRKSGETRYALKMVRRDVFQSKGNDKNTVAGVCDLAIETAFLSSLEHPNIIKLRAIACMEHPFSKDYFLVLDRLKETLSKRIHNKWNLKEKRLYNFWGRFRDRKGAKRLDFFEHRLERAYDLGCAIQYLHEKKIIHRDIKPDNIGFDIRDDIKLFDFGMARELEDDLKVDDENYRLSMCGSPRYMAPEVWMKSPYNHAADVYSFGIVLFEMIALTRAFGQCDASNSTELADRVVQSNARPDLDTVRAPPSIKALLPNLWHPNAQYRCDMRSACLAMRKELILLRRGDESRLPDFTRRRSTFIFKQRDSKNLDQSFAESVHSILSAPLATSKEHKRSSVANIDVLNISVASLDLSSKSIRLENGA